MESNASSQQPWSQPVASAPRPVAKRRFTIQTVVGVCLFCASPFIAFFAFAVGATVLEEARLESGGDLVWIGPTGLFLPVILGITLVIMDLLGLRLRLGRRGRTVAAATLVLGGLVALGLGIFAIVDGAASADPAIGAIFLFLVGFGLLALAALLFFKRSGARN